MSSENGSTQDTSQLVFSDLRGHRLSPPLSGVGPRRNFCNGFLDEGWQVLQPCGSRMPSPVGHALGGLVAAFAVDSLARRQRLTLPLLAASASLAVAPDLDILAGSHRTYSHSVGA